MVGSRFGRWVVLADLGTLPIGQKGKFARKVAARCDCGIVKEIFFGPLKNGTSTSCGCRRLEVAKVFHRKHNHELYGKKTRTYTSWDNMVQRCTNKNREEYPYYGGLGVTICDRWKDFRNFFNDMGERPEALTLDREDPYGDYTPENCRWVSRAEQSRNHRMRPVLQR
jgi:hypothetical protein